MKKNTQTTKFVATSLLIALLMVAGGLYYLFLMPEVDSVAQNAPLDSKIVSIEQQIELESQITAPSGIAYDYDHQQFLVITDNSEFFVLKEDLSEVRFKSTLQDRLEKEGITYIGDNQAVLLSEDGTVLFMQESEEHKWVESRRQAKHFAPSGPLGSAAYDRVNQHIYTANKRGEKVIYQLDREGKLIDSFPLRLSDQLTAQQAYDLTTDYTVAGMTYSDGYLYLLSEAYSTIFKLNVETREVDELFGVNEMLESAGITAKDQHTFYVIGDAEAYLPKPPIYQVRLPSASPATSQQ
jgi:uncharacterized protein YjiK